MAKWNVTITTPELDNNPEPEAITQERIADEVRMICTETFALEREEYAVEVAPAEVPAEEEAPAERTGTEG